MVKTLKEARERIRNAMKPPEPTQANRFSPGIQNLRQTASRARPAQAGRASPAKANRRRPPQPGRQLPTAR